MTDTDDMRDDADRKLREAEDEARRLREAADEADQASEESGS